MPGPRLSLSNPQWKALLKRMFKKKGPAKLTRESAEQIMKHQPPVTREMTILKDLGKITPQQEAAGVLTHEAVPFAEAKKRFAKDPERFRIGQAKPMTRLEAGQPITEGAFGELGLKFEKQTFKRPVPIEVEQALNRKLSAAPGGPEIGAKALEEVSTADTIWKEVFKGKRGIAGKLWDQIWKSSGKRHPAKRFPNSRSYFDWFRTEWETKGPQALRDQFPREVRLMDIADDLYSMGPEQAETAIFEKLRGRVPAGVRQRLKGGFER